MTSLSLSFLVYEIGTKAFTSWHQLVHKLEGASEPPGGLIAGIRPLRFSFNAARGPTTHLSLHFYQAPGDTDAAPLGSTL